MSPLLRLRAGPLTGRLAASVSVAAALAWLSIPAGVQANPVRDKPAAMAASESGQAQAGRALAGETPAVPAELEMFAGETRVLPAAHTGRLAVGNGSALSAAVLDDREILLIANQPGVSSLHIWTKNGRSKRMRVHVLAGETGRITREIAQFLGTMPNVSVRAIGDKVIVQGEQLSDEERAKIEVLAKRYPQIINFTGQQGWEKMIHMDVKVVEIGRDRLRDLGIKWASEAQGPSIGVAGDLKHNDYFVPVGDVKGEQALRDRHPYVPPFKSSFGIVSELSSRLRLLEQEGQAVTLAEPQLSARSGSKAEFQVGGEVPYTVTGPLGQTSIAFKSYGVILEVQPSADHSGAIRSRIKAEVSEPDTSLTSTTGVPGLRMRRTETEFNVRDGETMVLSGIINRRGGEMVDKVPGLGSVPLIGSLFRSKRFIQNESELLIFVTPRIVAAGDAQLAERRQAMERRAAAVRPTAQPPSATPPSEP